MYAIIKTGGKQYRVSQGDTITVERLESKVGETVTIDDVLFVGGDDAIHVGTPRVASASVLGTVVAQARARKVRVFKFKKRKHYRKTRGHRQSFTQLRIESIRA